MAFHSIPSTFFFFLIKITAIKKKRSIPVNSESAFKDTTFKGLQREKEERLYIQKIEADFPECKNTTTFTSANEFSVAQDNDG